MKQDSPFTTCVASAMSDGYRKGLKAILISLVRMQHCVPEYIGTSLLIRASSSRSITGRGCVDLVAEWRIYLSALRGFTLQSQPGHPVDSLADVMKWYRKADIYNLTFMSNLHMDMVVGQMISLSEVFWRTLDVYKSMPDLFSVMTTAVRDSNLDALHSAFRMIDSYVVDVEPKEPQNVLSARDLLSPRTGTVKVSDAPGDDNNLTGINKLQQEVSTWGKTYSRVAANTVFEVGPSVDASQNCVVLGGIRKWKALTDNSQYKSMPYTTTVLATQRSSTFYPGYSCC
eukprot:GHVU01217208.1.p1 GENE.GHVU01217208.1~~GHVU01217208.1.p1  ORF type:complete len:286 (-),score=27.11 GHVU01217208.1:2099-2956(-)